MLHAVAFALLNIVAFPADRVDKNLLGDFREVLVRVAVLREFAFAVFEALDEFVFLVEPAPRLFVRPFAFLERSLKQVAQTGLQALVGQPHTLRRVDINFAKQAHETGEPVYAGFERC